MVMPEKICAWENADAAKGFGSWCPVDAKYGAASDERFYIRADLVDDLVKALEEARRDMRNAWGAVTSNQVEDKDVAGGLRSAMGRIDAALTRIKGDVT